MAESSEVTELKELADHYLTLQENCKASSQADLARAVYWTKLGTFMKSWRQTACGGQTDSKSSLPTRTSMRDLLSVSEPRLAVCTRLSL